MNKLIASALGLLLALQNIAVGQAAPTLTFTAQTTTGNGSVVPILTWSTTPAATSCTASGDTTWTGTKAASGTATLSAVTSSKTYNLTCTWPADSSAVLTWVPPTQNTDNSPFTDPNGYNIHYGTSSTALSQTLKIPSPTTLTTTISNLAVGTWFFCIGTVNLNNVEGPCSNIASKVFATGSVSRSVGITVNPVPAAGVLTVS